MLWRPRLTSPSNQKDSRDHDPNPPKRGRLETILHASGRFAWMMALRILLREHPQRSIALVTSSHALIFRHSSSSQPNLSPYKSQPPRCMVELSALTNVDISDYKPLRSTSVYGTLGLINVHADVFLCVITAASPVAAVRPGENVQKIVSVEFYCLNKGDYDQGLHDETTLYDNNDSSSDLFDQYHGQDHREPPVEHPCLALTKMLRDGTFYYSVDFDLTNRLQNRYASFQSRKNKY